MSGNTLCTEPIKTTDDIKKPESILFVCTGNTCRSPMAAALFNALFPWDDRRASSAGLYATGSPISGQAVCALRARGIEPTSENHYTAHISRPVTEDAVRDAALVVGMTSSHAMELILRFPRYATKIYTMPEDISDPYGGDLARYEQCLREIENGLRQIAGDTE